MEVIKIKTNTFWALLLVAVLVFASQTPIVEVKEDGITDAQLVDSGVSFTGQDILVKSTDVTSEDVRVIKYNDDGEIELDLGAFALSSSNMDTTPTKDYKFYFFMNNTAPSSNYYVNIQDYTAPIQDAVDDVVGKGCGIDSSLKFISYDANGGIQTATSNAQALGASETVTMSIRIKASRDKCYGMPDIEEENAVCFLYNSTVLSLVEAGKSAANPKSITSSTETQKANTQALACYEFPVLQDGEYVDIPVSLTTTATQPDIDHNITVMSDDIAFDLNADTLAEIYGYEDEDGNQLAANVTLLGKMYIS